MLDIDTCVLPIIFYLTFFEAMEALKSEMAALTSERNEFERRVTAAEEVSKKSCEELTQVFLKFYWFSSKNSFI